MSKGIFSIKQLKESKCAHLNTHIVEVLSEKVKQPTNKKTKTNTANFELCCKEDSLTYEKEVKFCPTRRWRTDFMFSKGEKRIAVEIEGGVHSDGRHTRGKGFVKDIEKYNTYITMGIQLLRFTTEDIEKRPATCVGTIKEAMNLN